MVSLRSFRFLSDLFLPRLCTVCRQRLSVEEDVICLSCNALFPLVELKDFEDNEMLRLMWSRTDVTRAATLFYYRPGSEMVGPVKLAKYNQNPFLAEYLGERLASALLPKGFFEGMDVIVPVPVTRTRRLERGYNQSEWLAKGVHGVTGIPLAQSALQRIHADAKQVEKNGMERTVTREDDFRVADPACLSGRHILLLDDVFTTGTTLCSCALAIRKVLPDAQISVCTLAWSGDI